MLLLKVESKSFKLLKTHFELSNSIIEREQSIATIV